MTRGEYVREDFQHAGCRVRIIHDEDAENPYFDWDGMDHLLTWHRRQTFSSDNWSDWGMGFYQGYVWKLDEEGYEEHTMSPQHIVEWLEQTYDAVVVPVYLYDHSVQAVSTTPFGDRWDSGQLGVAFMTGDEILQEFQRDDEKTRALVKERLAGNIETLNMYLQGDIWGYEVTGPDRSFDSCWGFYGFDEARQEACEIAESLSTGKDVTV